VGLLDFHDSASGRQAIIPVLHEMCAGISPPDVGLFNLSLLTVYV
jgi:hypothetical protein